MTLTIEDLTFRTEQVDIELARAEARAEFERRFATGKPAMIERALSKGYEFTALAAARSNA